MIFPYHILPANNETVKKPWVKVRLGSKKTHKFTSLVFALLDTGADVCFCSVYIADWLGVDYKKKKAEVFTAANGSKFEAKKIMLNLSIEKKEEECPFYVYKEIPQNCPIILGQKGFMYKHSIKFDAPNDCIEVD